ncbi:hypothetical protein ACFE04_001507 [Oxalis oulophora]
MSKSEGTEDDRQRQQIVEFDKDHDDQNQTQHSEEENCDDEPLSIIKDLLINNNKSTVDVEDADDDDENDGYKTPTSLEHKIPIIQCCPPAPRKPKPNKRKFSDLDGVIYLDLSMQELETIFSVSKVVRSHDVLKNKIKKFRGDIVKD